jgi:hypothetical protein
MVSGKADLAEYGACCAPSPVRSGKPTIAIYSVWAKAMPSMIWGNFLSTLSRPIAFKPGPLRELVEWGNYCG